MADMTKFGSKPNLYTQGKALMSPEDNEAQAMRQKQAMLDEYKAGTQPQPTAPVQGSPYGTANVDKVNPQAQYGQNPGEQRIDTSSMTKPLGSAMPSYSDGTDSVPNDQVAKLDQGEAVVPADQNPSNDGGGMMSGIKDYGSDVSSGLKDEAHGLVDSVKSLGKDGPRLSGESSDAAAPRPYGLEPATIKTGPLGIAPLGSAMPKYDKGTNYVPEDQVAQLHEGEEVIPADKNPNNPANQQGAPADFAGPVYPNPDDVKPQWDTDRPEGQKVPGADTSNGKPAKMDTSNPPQNDMETNEHDASMKSYGKGALPGPQPTPDVHPAEDPIQIAHAQIQHDKLEAAKNGDLVGLGMAVLNEKELRRPSAFKPITGEPDAPSATAGIDAAVSGIAPAPAAGAPAPETQGAASTSGAPAPYQAPKTPEEYKATIDKINQDILAAAHTHTPEAQKAVGYLTKEKAILEKMNPYGSATNHPGLLGKIEHGLGEVGNVAGNTFASGVMPSIPGTQANIAKQEAQGDEGVKQGEANALDEAEVNTRNEVAKQASTNAALAGKLLVAGYALGKDAQGNPTLTQVPGFRDSPKNVQEGLARATQDAMDKGVDPATDKAVQSWQAQAAAAAKPKAGTKEENLENFQNVVSKLDTVHLPTSGKALDKSLDTALANKVITPEEHAGAKAYQAANPTPGTTFINKEASADSAEGRAIDKMFKGKNVMVETPEGGHEIMSYDKAKEKGFNADQMSTMTTAQSEKTKVDVGNAIDTKQAFIDYRDDLNKTAHTLTQGDKDILGQLARPETEAKESGAIGKVVEDLPAVGPLTGAINTAVNGIITQKAYEGLSPAGKKLVADYYTAVISNFADMKRRLGSVGRNPSMLSAEMHTVPAPNIDLMAANDAFNNKFKSLEARNKLLPRVDGKHPDDIKINPHPIGSTIVQDGKSYIVKTLDKNGKVTGVNSVTEGK